MPEARVLKKLSLAGLIKISLIHDKIFGRYQYAKTGFFTHKKLQYYFSKSVHGYQPCGVWNRIKDFFSELRSI